MATCVCLRWSAVWCHNWPYASQWACCAVRCAVLCGVQVRDLCENFHRSKREFWLLHAHYTAGGKMPPTDDDGRRMQLIQKLEVEDNQRKRAGGVAWALSVTAMHAYQPQVLVCFLGRPACSTEALCLYSCLACCPVGGRVACGTYGVASWQGAWQGMLPGDGGGRGLVGGGCCALTVFDPRRSEAVLSSRAMHQ